MKMLAGGVMAKNHLIENDLAAADPDHPNKGKNEEEKAPAYVIPVQEDKPDTGK